MVCTWQPFCLLFKPAGFASASAAGRMIVAHLGNGASLCAMRAGRSAPGAIWTAVNDAVRPLGIQVQQQPIMPEHIVGSLAKR